MYSAPFSQHSMSLLYQSIARSSTSRNTLPNSPSRLLIALAMRLQISVKSMAGPMLHHHGSPITGSRPVEALATLALPRNRINCYTDLTHAAGYRRTESRRSPRVLGAPSLLPLGTPRLFFGRFTAMMPPIHQASDLRTGG